MKWKVEFITEDSSNILIDDPTYTNNDDLEVVGMGFPISLAERLVFYHNDCLDKLIKTEEKK